MQSFKDLEIYNLAFDYFIETHKMTLKLPKHELYEQGSQLRRSTASIKDNIVEGYGRKRYKQDFIKFLTYAHASLLEAQSQIKALSVLYNESFEFAQLYNKYDKLGAKLYNFIKYVERNWKT